MRGRAAWWKYDIRRVWVCPLCSRRVKTGGDVVNQACDCQANSNPPQQVWMRLVEEAPRREATAAAAPEGS
jgi:hypothetical protein